MIDYNKLKPYWFVACKSKVVKKKPISVTILGVPLVIFRTYSGVVALQDRCPHRNAPLSKGVIKNNKIECPYHGWQFDSNGICKRIPGLCYMAKNFPKIDAFCTQEKYGFVWVCLVSPLKHELYKPLFYDNSKYHTFIEHREVNGQLINIAENFLDATHTHFVHKGLIRHDNKRQHVRVCINSSISSVEACYYEESKQSGIISQLLEQNRDKSYGRFILPSVVELEYIDLKGTSLLITLYITPTEGSQHQIYSIISIRKSILPRLAMKLLIYPFLELAYRQDKKILDLQQQNIERFGGKEKFMVISQDILYPYIRSLINEDNETKGNHTETTVVI